MCIAKVQKINERDNIVLNIMQLFKLLEELHYMKKSKQIIY